MQRDPSTKLLWENLLSVCDGLADSVQELRVAQGDVEEYVEAIDLDLGDLEEEIYGAHEEDDDEELVGDDLVRASCPRCGEEAYFEEEFLYDDHVEISCPDCGEILFRGGEHTLEFEQEDSQRDSQRDEVGIES